jgi:conserved oligomeric Golgi complex subunit 6
MLEEAETLLARKRETETKRQLLGAFSQHFLLTDEEVRTLESGSSDVGDHSFDLLGRMKQIHKDCQLLLGTEDQQLGLELMDQSSRNLNSAYQKLYRWMEDQFKSFDPENPRMSAPLRRALRQLAERPTLFESCLETFAITTCLLGLIQPPSPSEKLSKFSFFPAAMTWLKVLW